MKLLSIALTLLLLMGCQRAQTSETTSQAGVPAQRSEPAGLVTVPPDAPVALRRLLDKDAPDHRLLTPKDVGNDFLRQQYVKFQPWSVGDTNKDGEQDVAAVLVKDSNPPLYSVIVIHGGSTADVAWIWRDVTTRILSVRAETGEVWPLTCIECDANRPLRWIGHEYDWDVLMPGESVCLSAGIVLLDEPDDSAIRKISLPRTLEMKVVEIGKRDPGKDRWFKVVTPDDRFPVEGWIRTAKNWEGGLCE
jgi:hypothetical protein